MDLDDWELLDIGHGDLTTFRGAKVMQQAAVCRDVLAVVDIDAVDKEEAGFRDIGIDERADLVIDKEAEGAGDVGEVDEDDEEEEKMASVAECRACRWPFIGMVGVAAVAVLAVVLSCSMSPEQHHRSGAHSIPLGPAQPGDKVVGQYENATSS